jgi:GDP-L-fucose synthase
MPKDSYGWGQNIKSRLCAQTDNFYNIRIFNCFGKGEIFSRIFPRFLSQGYLEISNDRYFDYFSIQDLCKIVQHCAENDWPVKDVNAVYQDKYKISQVIEQFCNLNDLEPNFKVLSTIDNNYTGSGCNLASLAIPLNGLKHGLKNY